MVIGNFALKRIPNGRKNYKGDPLYDYVLVHSEYEKYCVYGSQYYFIMAPQKKNGVYRIVCGSVSFSAELGNTGITGEYINNHRYCSHWLQDFVPYHGDKISNNYFNVNWIDNVAIFETLDEAKEVCDLFNKQLKEKRKNDEHKNDLAEYERLKEKLGL